MESAIAISAAGALALVICAGMIPLVLLVSHRREWYDIPNERKIHTSPVPRLGGIGIFWGFMIAAIIVPLVLPSAFPGAMLAGSLLRSLPLFLAFGLLHGTGLVDDFHNLHALLKFLLQIAAAALVTVGGFTISGIRIPGLGLYSLGIFSYPITVLWIVSISNAINLVDGVDGLAGGISGIAALSLGIMALLRGQAAPALMAFALLGAVIGFLAFNLPPARIFMGDSGSLFLGFVLATIPLAVAPGATLFGDMFAPATILLIPIIDTISAIVRRVRERRAIHSADKEHIHHKLLALGLKERPILIIIYGFSACLGIAGIASLSLPHGIALALLGAACFAGLLAYWTLNAIGRKRKAVAARLGGRS